mgnify:FL=1
MSFTTIPHTPTEGLAAEAAGHLSERDLWLAVLTVSQALAPLHAQGQGHGHLTAESLIVTPTGFVLAPFTATPTDAKTSAPSDVWALGALTYHLALGLPLFGGRGPEAQTAETPLPIIRESWPLLSQWVRLMLQADPAARPTMEQIAETARQRLEEPFASHPPLRSAASEGDGDTTTPTTDSAWPEVMC